MGQLVLLAYQVRSNDDVRLIRVWSVTLMTPIARVLEVVRANTIGLVENYFVLVNVRQDNRKLGEELGRLKLENHFLRSELNTADRVRALQAFQARTPSRTLPARIIGTATGTNSRVVFVDQGSGSGVMRGMAVVTPDGIVGKVLAAYPTASQVQLITDSTFAAGVISDKNRVHGTVKGLGQSKCAVEYVQNEENVEVGEMFYTSGDDRIFPKGMPVGRVTVVRPGKTFKEIFLVPSGLAGGLEEVLIVIHGVHQDIPEAPLTSSKDVYILPPPPGSQSGSTPAGASAALMTDADRLRERYRHIGEAQGHVFGTGLPGSKPPNFNVDLKSGAPAARPNTPQSGKAAPPSPAPGVAPPAASSASGAQAPARPPAAAAGLPSGSSAPRQPAGTDARARIATGQPAARPPQSGTGTPTGSAVSVPAKPKTTLSGAPAGQRGPAESSRIAGPDTSEKPPQPKPTVPQPAKPKPDTTPPPSQER
jgi:rod shape-determining protein MreC